eukprot:TRINITY_DN1023_c0_g1_i4.p1 TRINITY_DN1023_c0_g1~~TRINITY_DN1023_c0_g1_i4.p1  ORF type:complete len:153 (+),score=25.39 TRINITY_DN1023_c0_g1_i4:47-460(+)
MLQGPELPEEISDDECDQSVDMMMQFQLLQGSWVDSSNNSWSIKEWEVTSIRETDGFVQKFQFEETDHRLYLNHARVEHVGGDLIIWSFSPIFLQGSTWVRPQKKKIAPTPVVPPEQTFVICDDDDISSTSSDWVVV